MKKTKKPATSLPSFDPNFFSKIAIEIEKQIFFIKFYTVMCKGIVPQLSGKFCNDLNFVVEELISSNPGQISVLTIDKKTTYLSDAQINS